MLKLEREYENTKPEPLYTKIKKIDSEYKHKYEEKIKIHKRRVKTLAKNLKYLEIDEIEKNK